MPVLVMILNFLCLANVTTALVCRRALNFNAGIDCSGPHIASQTHDRNVFISSNNRSVYLGFLYRNCSPTSYHGGGYNFRSPLLAKEENVEEVIQGIYDSLKAKQTTFVDLQNRLKEAGISLEGCKKPDDVIRRVAQLDVLGKDRLEDEIKKTDPKFQAILNDVFSAKLSSYKSKGSKDRGSYIASLREILKKNKVDIDEKATDEAIIRLASEIESAERLALQLPDTMPGNDGSQKIDSYKEEADSIFGAYKKLSDDKSRDVFMSQVKEALEALNIDYKDCNNDEEIINRLAYARVFPRVEKPKAQKKKDNRKLPQGPSWDKMMANNNDPFAGLFNFGNMQGLFDMGNGLFEDQDMSNLFEEGDGMEGSFSVLKDIAKMFGVDLGDNNKQKLVFDNEESPATTPHAEVEEETEDTEEEEIDDDELRSIFMKAKETNDRTLMRILSKCSKDSVMRDALKMANRDGYEAAKDEYKDNKSVLYILEKLYERGVFE